MNAVSRAIWLDRFVMHLSNLGVRAQPENIAEMAEELWETEGDRDPVEVAQTEWEMWPPHDD